MKVLVGIELGDVDLIAGEGLIAICCLFLCEVAVGGERTVSRFGSLYHFGYFGPDKLFLTRICLLSSYIVLWKVAGRIFSF